jgi:hypothetical protein
MQKFKCRFCNEELEVSHRDGDWFFIRHVSSIVINVPGIGIVNAACDGMMKPLAESVAVEDTKRADEFLSLRRPTTAPKTQKGPQGEDTARKDGIQKRFEEFHAKNPKVYELLRQRAFELKQAGHQTYGIDTMFGWLRWHKDLAISETEPFKLSNDLRSRYARYLMQKEPELQGFFEIRPLTTLK